MIDPHNIFKRLRSDCEAERMVAANKLYGVSRTAADIPMIGKSERRAATQKHRYARQPKRCMSTRQASAKKAEASAAKERKAREKADAQNAKLREQLNTAKTQAKAAPDPNKRVDLLSGLLSQETIDKLSPEQIAERMETLFGERDTRQHNVAAQIDLVIGRLTEALYQRHTRLFGKRKRGSNAPTVSEFLETHAGKSASWCRRCVKTYSIVTAEDWDAGCWDGTGGIEGIIKAASDPNRPKV